MQVRLSHGSCTNALPTCNHGHITHPKGIAPSTHLHCWLPPLPSPPCARQRGTLDGRRSTAKRSRSRSMLSASRPLETAVMEQDSAAAAVPNAAGGAIAAGPTTPKPSYEAIDSQPQNRLFMHLFRGKLAEGLGEDAPEPG